uniref:Small cardiac-like peptide B n=1 Tax=Pleurobranchaea californica TaxID=404816 RepID=I1SKH6_9GAST|nr:small cardiac-like peptide B [Pleurobranchaea californica]
MEINMSRTTTSLAVLIVVIICTVDAMNYLAFPRMGRSGYLAFPRMGRAPSKADASGDSSDCCRIGLKSVLFVNADGKEDLRNMCSVSGGACCEGLRDFVDEKQDGVIYSMCIPDLEMTRLHSSQVYSKLKRLLQN